MNVQVKGAELVKKLGAVVAFDIDGTVGGFSFASPLESRTTRFPMLDDGRTVRTSNVHTHPGGSTLEPALFSNASPSIPPSDSLAGVVRRRC